MRTALIALLLLTTPCTALASDADTKTSVMVIGDSHIERLGPMIDRAVEHEGYESLGHLARRGWSTARYIREADLVERLTENGTPDIVVISLGGNDRCRSEDRYREQLTWIVDRVREAGVQRIVWLGPAASDMERSERAQMVGEWHERMAEWQSQMLPELGVEWIDSRPLTQSGHGMDGIHFTGRAYSTWMRGALREANILPAEVNVDAPVDAPVLARTGLEVV